MTRLFAGTPFDRPPRCDRCGELEEKCQCPPRSKPEPTWIAPQQQSAKVRVDRRKHKRFITIVSGLAADETNLPELLSKLQSACGAGGSIQEGQIEIQGDHGTGVKKQLATLGYRVK